MNKCKVCGGSLTDIGGGNFRCTCCRATFSASDFAAKPKKSISEQKESVSVSGADVFDNNVGGVLEISWTHGNSEYSGSGLIITSDGYAITNTHVVSFADGRSCGSVTVKVCDENIKADVIRLGDDKHGAGNGVDLALIKLRRMPADAKALTFADSEKVRNGENVYVIGNSLGYGTCITSGIVSDRARSHGGKVYVMHDCAANGGNSGGPLFNAQGYVIGIHVSSQLNNGALAVGMKYAIPSRTACEFIKKCGVNIGRLI